MQTYTYTDLGCDRVLQISVELFVYLNNGLKLCNTFNGHGDVMSHLRCYEAQGYHLFVFEAVYGNGCTDGCFAHGYNKFSLASCFESIVILF